MTPKTAEQANDIANAMAAIRAAKNAEAEAKIWARVSVEAQAKVEEAKRAHDYMERQKEAFLQACEQNRSAAFEVKEWQRSEQLAKERARSAMEAAAAWVAIVPEEAMLKETANHV